MNATDNPDTNVKHTSLSFIEVTHPPRVKQQIIINKTPHNVIARIGETNQLRTTFINACHPIPCIPTAASPHPIKAPITV